MTLNVSDYMGGDFMTQKNLILPYQVLTITTATEELVGDEKDRKICVGLSGYPTKKLALNQTNLGRIANLYGMNAEAWQGKSLGVYRSRTDYAGKSMLCIRVCEPGETPQEPVLDLQGNQVDLSPAPGTIASPEPAAMPLQQSPVAPPQVNAWPTGEENNPPSA